MVQVLQITLREAEFKNKLTPNAKALVRIKFGDSEKSFPNSRNIKNEICKFYGERMSLSSQQPEFIDKALLFLSVIENGKSTDFGSVEIDINIIKEHKDNAKVSFDLQNELYYITFEALSSSYGGMSEIDNKSERSEILSPLRPQSVIADKGKSKQELKNVLQYTPKEKGSNDINSVSRDIKTQIKKDAEKAVSRTFELNKKTSLNEPVKLIDEDRKSEISQRPVKISRTSNRQTKITSQLQASRQHSQTKSAINLSSTAKQSTNSKVIKPQIIKKQQRPLTPPRSTRKIEAPSISKKKVQQQSGILQIFQKNTNAQYAAIIIFSFILGIIFKKI